MKKLFYNNRRYKMRKILVVGMLLAGLRVFASNIPQSQVDVIQSIEIEVPIEVPEPLRSLE